MALIVPLGSKVQDLTPKPLPKEFEASVNGAAVTQTDKNLYLFTDDSRLCSLIGNGCFAMNDPGAVPYYEVTIKDFDPDRSTVAIGFGDKNFVDLPGCVKNSYGWHFKRGISKLFNSSVIELQGLTSRPWGNNPLSPGDTIGCGVMYDSFNSRYFVYTKNGQFVGFSGIRVHTGMDLYPAIGLTHRAIIEANFGEKPFLWDASIIKASATPGPDQLTPSGNGYMEELPDEILQLIINATVHGTRDISLRFSRLSKRFRNAANTNEVWKNLFLRRWPSQNPNLKLKSWRSLYRARVELKRQGRKLRPIENCEFQFQCPMVIERLAPLKVGPNEKGGEILSDGFPDFSAYQTINPFKEHKSFHCSKCEKDVYAVQTQDQLDQHVSLGHCVAVARKDESYLIGIIDPTDNYWDQDYY
jgi:hypothetical protein